MFPSKASTRRVDPETGEVFETDYTIQDVDRLLERIAGLKKELYELTAQLSNLVVMLDVKDYSYAGLRVQRREDWRTLLPAAKLAELALSGHPAVRTRAELDRRKLKRMLDAGGEIAEKVKRELELERETRISLSRERRKGVSDD